VFVHTAKPCSCVLLLLLDDRMLEPAAKVGIDSEKSQTLYYHA
jgi:hypothetical protein